jgi:hypothetical protein
MNIFKDVPTSVQVILIILTVLLAAALVLLIFLYRRFGNLEAKYKKFMRNSEGVSNIEDVIFRCMEEIDYLKKEYVIANNRIVELDGRTAFDIQKVAVKRYNVFEDVGSDQSFSVVLLNRNNDGVMLTGLYTREGTTTFAKPISNGLCQYMLSAEEKDVLEDALNAKH